MKKAGSLAASARNLALTSALLILSPAGVQALEAIPLYEPVPIGAMIRDAHPTAGISTAAAVNQAGDTVGRVLIDGVYRAFVYTELHGVQLLPPLPGWTSHVAVDVTDRDVETGSVLIAGSAQTVYGDPDRSVVWEYDPQSGLVLDSANIGVPPGADWSAATAVNDRGLVVGYGRAAGWLSPYQPFVYDWATGTLHTLDIPFNPVDINSFDVIAGGTYRAQLVETASGFEVSVLDNLATTERPSVSRITALNDADRPVGVTPMGYTDGAGRMVTGAVRYVEGGGWGVLWANSAYDAANDVNLAGDAVGSTGVSSAIRPFVYVEAVQRGFLVNDLVDPSLPPAWADYAANGINEDGWIVAGASSAVLFKRIGDMPPPTPPGNATALPHEPTWQQPWNAISVSWQNTSGFTRTYSLERSPSGANAWQEIMTERNMLQYNDTNGELGQLYDYRVIANGLAGPSAPSSVVTARFPSDPVDQTPPQITITAPADGAEVSGRVSIVAEFVDEGGLEYAEISVSQGGSETILCSRSPDGATALTLSCTWRSKRVPLGTYALAAYSFDMLGNWTSHSVMVSLVDDAGVPSEGGKRDRKR